MLSLRRMEHGISEILQSIHQKSPLRSRVILRKTLNYQNHLKGIQKRSEFKVPLFKSEIKQLERGDIPYYFLYLDRLTLYHLSEEMEPVVADVNFDPTFKLIKLHPHRLIQNNLPPERKHANTLTYAGALQIARILDSGEATKKRFEDLNLVVKNGILTLIHPSIPHGVSTRLH